MVRKFKREILSKHSKEVYEETLRKLNIVLDYIYHITNIERRSLKSDVNCSDIIDDVENIDLICRVWTTKYDNDIYQKLTNFTIIYPIITKERRRTKIDIKPYEMIIEELIELNMIRLSVSITDTDIQIEDEEME